MKTFLFQLFLAIMFFSCTEKTQERKPEISTEPPKVSNLLLQGADSMAAKAFMDSANSIVYRGRFPCRDCAGIWQTILFRKDNTYLQEQSIAGKNKPLQKSYGSWRIEGDKIELIQNGKSEIVFRISSDTLFAVNISNVALNDSSKYSLIKRKLASVDPVWNKKRSQGIDFFGMGNEPAWTIEIVNGKSVRFKLENRKEDIVAPLESIVENSDSIVYHLTSDQVSWSVIIFPEFCMVGNSDDLYRYKVVVTHEGEVYTGCGIMLHQLENL